MSDPGLMVTILEFLAALFVFLIGLSVLFHARLVTENGRSISLEELYGRPPVVTVEQKTAQIPWG